LDLRCLSAFRGSAEVGASFKMRTVKKIGIARKNRIAYGPEVGRR